VTGAGALQAGREADKRRPRAPLRWLRWLALTVLVTLGAAIMLVPIVWMLSTSLKPSDAILTLPPRLIPAHPTLAPYRAVIEAFPMVRVFVNSLLVAAATTLGQLVLSSMAGYAFARFQFRGRDLLFFLYLATLMVPFVVTVTPLFIIVRHLGWTNSYAGLIVPPMFSAFGTFLMRQFFLDLPRELEEAAVIDGASTFTMFARVIVPLSGPAFATLGIFSFMASWNNFLWPLLIVSDTKFMTLPLALATLQGLYPGQTQWNLVMAGTVISVVPMIVVFLLAQRWVIQGITASGLKG
jgi:multiple sugar transport system permease protein